MKRSIESAALRRSDAFGIHDPFQFAPYLLYLITGQSWHFVNSLLEQESVMHESLDIDVLAAGVNVVDMFVRLPEHLSHGEKQEVFEMLVQGADRLPPRRARLPP